jgi:hypothetical protein
VLHLGNLAVLGQLSAVTTSGSDLWNRITTSLWNCLFWQELPLKLFLSGRNWFVESLLTDTNCGTVCSGRNYVPVELSALPWTTCRSVCSGRNYVPVELPALTGPICGSVFPGRNYVPLALSVLVRNTCGSACSGKKLPVELSFLAVATYENNCSVMNYLWNYLFWQEQPMELSILAGTTCGTMCFFLCSTPGPWPFLRTIYMKELVYKTDSKYYETWSGFRNFRL